MKGDCFSFLWKMTEISPFDYVVKYPADVNGERYIAEEGAFAEEDLDPTSHEHSPEEILRCI